MGPIMIRDRGFLVLLLAIVLLIFLSCKKDNLAGPDSGSDRIKADSLFAEIDTTLVIQTVQEGNLTIYKIDKYKTVVVKIPRISSYLFFTNPTRSLKEIAQDSNYALVVNASYFDYAITYAPGDTIRSFKHAGFLKIHNIVYEEVKDDRQASRLFAYNSERNIVDYFSINDLARTKEYDLVVQVGPQIIRKNEVDTASIDASINGSTPWPRTVFASVNGKEFYIVVNLNYAGVTLRELGTMLRLSGIFRKELNAINFDGGFSTSLYIRNHPEFSTGADNRMPLLIGVR